MPWETSGKARLVAVLLAVAALAGLAQTLGGEAVFHLILLAVARLLWNAKFYTEPKAGVNDAPTQEKPELPPSAMRPSKRGDSDG